MVQLTPLDWFWIITFLILMVGCGVLFYRLGKRSCISTNLPAGRHRRVCACRAR